MAAHNKQAAMQLRLAKPFVRAYVLGLLSSTGPRVASLLLLLGKRRIGVTAAFLQIVTIFRRATELHRFPAFCGVLVGGSAAIQAPIHALIEAVVRVLQPGNRADHGAVRTAARFVAALLSASVSFRLLNSSPKEASTVGLQYHQPQTHLEVVKPGPFDEPPERKPLGVNDSAFNAKLLTRADLAGKTMDLTLFSGIRAMDIILSYGWERAAPTNQSRLADLRRKVPSLLFCFSAATIMHAWFYSPSRLPQTYNRWISTAADLDHRLLLALRHARFGTWVYGRDTGMTPLLSSMCRDYGLPEVWGDPSKTIPVPCELVHMGRGKSCEKHAFARFCQSWGFAAKMYGPVQILNLALKARTRAGPDNKTGLSRDMILRAATDVTRSSAFLGAFISLFYYGVCASRTRIGPKLFSSKTVTPQMWDSGLCVLVGCMLCGFSILIEQERKRLEILFFVLPRAVATWLPRRYTLEHRWKEHVVFALSCAVVLTTAQESPKRVRGLLGNLLRSVLKVD